MRKDNHGVAGFTLLLGVLLIAVIGYASYVVFFQEDAEEVVDTGDSTSVRASDEETGMADPIESANDIEQQFSDIETLDLDNEFDTSELDAELQNL